jgi:hypothetical protein
LDWIGFRSFNTHRTTPDPSPLQAFKFFPKDRKMALVQLPTVEESITALVRLHNYQLSETSHLRCGRPVGSIIGRSLQGILLEKHNLRRVLVAASGRESTLVAIVVSLV